MAAILLLGACSTVSKDDEAYKRSKSLPPLEVPPDLITPSQDPTMAVPPVSAAKGVPVPADAGTSVPVPEAPPSVERARLVKEGAQRWLVIKGEVADVIAEVRSFWAQAGSGLVQEDAGMGIVETEWREGGQTSAPQGNAADAELDKALRTALRDKYRMRVEPGREQGTVELHLSHQGLQRIPVEGKPEWQPRPTDAMLEAEMLQRLQAYFNGSNQDGVKSPKPMSSGQPPVQSELVEDISGDVRMVIREDFDRSWRRIEHALEGAGFVINDRNRTTGVYEIRVGQAFKGDEGGSLFMRIFGGSQAFSPDMQYRLVLKGEGDKSTVIVQHASGGPEHGGMSRRILTKLQKNME